MSKISPFCRYFDRGCNTALKGSKYMCLSRHEGRIERTITELCLPYFGNIAWFQAGFLATSLFRRQSVYQKYEPEMFVWFPVRAHYSDGQTRSICDRASARTAAASMVDVSMVIALSAAFNGATDLVRSRSSRAFISARTSRNITDCPA